MVELVRELDHCKRLGPEPTSVAARQTIGLRLMSLLTTFRGVMGLTPYFVGHSGSNLN
jgi:hypothetical protein